MYFPTNKVLKLLLIEGYISGETCVHVESGTGHVQYCFACLLSLVCYQCLISMPAVGGQLGINCSSYIQ